MYPLYTGLSQQFTITIGQSFCFDVFGNDNESVIGVCNSLCILFDLGISVQLWAIIPVLVLIPLLLKKMLLQWIMHGLSMITGFYASFILQIVTTNRTQFMSLNPID